VPGGLRRNGLSGDESFGLCQAGLTLVEGPEMGARSSKRRLCGGVEGAYAESCYMLMG